MVRYTGDGVRFIMSIGKALTGSKEPLGSKALSLRHAWMSLGYDAQGKGSSLEVRGYSRLEQRRIV
jgi:hypothetical protein